MTDLRERLDRLPAVRREKIDERAKALIAEAARRFPELGPRLPLPPHDVEKEAGGGEQEPDADGR